MKEYKFENLNPDNYTVLQTVEGWFGAKRLSTKIVVPDEIVIKSEDLTDGERDTIIQNCYLARYKVSEDDSEVVSEREYDDVILIGGSTKSTAYTKIATFKYGGSNRSGNIMSMSVLAYMNNKSTSYAVRVFDKNNRNVLSERTDLTNETVEDIIFEIITDVPAEKTVLEVHMKVEGTGNKEVMCDSIHMAFGG